MRLCRSLGVLPYGGGLLDQPWIVVELLKMVISMENAKENREKGKRAAQ